MKMFKTAKGTEIPLTNLKGKDYLLVPHRVQWFREDNPYWTIETEIVARQADSTIFKATIKDEKGRVIATAHQQEDGKDFKDHLAKAETAAIGRAVALCGYGTQFAQELEMDERLSDAPLESKVHQERREEIKTIPVNMDQLNDLLAKHGKQSPVEGRADEVQEPFDESGPAFPFGMNETNQGVPESSRNEFISPAQARRLYAIGKPKHWEPGHLKTFLREKYQIEKPELIPWKQYKKICEWVESGTPDQVNKFWKP